MPPFPRSLPRVPDGETGPRSLCPTWPDEEGQPLDRYDFDAFPGPNRCLRTRPPRLSSQPNQALGIAPLRDDRRLPHQSLRSRDDAVPSEESPPEQELAD